MIKKKIAVEDFITPKDLKAITMERLSLQAATVYETAVEITNLMMSDFYKSPTFNGQSMIADALNNVAAAINRLADDKTTETPARAKEFRTEFDIAYDKAIHIGVSQEEMFALMDIDDGRPESHRWIDYLRNQRVGHAPYTIPEKEAIVIPVLVQPKRRSIRWVALTLEQRKTHIHDWISSYMNDNGCLPTSMKAYKGYQALYSQALIIYGGSWDEVIADYIKQL